MKFAGNLPPNPLFGQTELRSQRAQPFSRKNQFLRPFSHPLIQQHSKEAQVLLGLPARNVAGNH
jgi:hypothetical protein